VKERSSQVFFLISLFLLLTLLVAKQVTRPLDLAVTKAFQFSASSGFDYSMYFFSLIGSIEFSCFALLVVTWYLYRKYEWPGAFIYLFFFMALSLVEFVWKYVVTYTGPGPEFDRDPFHLGLIAIETPYSFPSGHTFRSVYLLGIWYQRLSHRDSANLSVLFQRAVIAFMILGVGFSRIYLGDHWLSDVIGGCLLAAIGLALASEPPHHELRPA
jgi:undecaprenyl-diphosphatase